SLQIHSINIPGSVLATEAHIDNDILFINGFDSSSKLGVNYGAVNGHLIAKSFNSKTRVNLFPLTCNADIQINAKPIVQNQQLKTPQNTAIEINVNVIDENPLSLQYQLMNSVGSGQLSGSLPNVIYLPEKDYQGNDSFTYKVTDQYGQSSQAIINISITEEIIFKNSFEIATQSLSLINSLSITGLITQIILWRRK
ncbi:MAG: Ig-like domain-containing protein, partial [Marinicellaceae bacterium]